jgi:hypothetical protein
MKLKMPCSGHAPQQHLVMAIPFGSGRTNG